MYLHKTISWIDISTCERISNDICNNLFWFINGTASHTQTEKAYWATVRHKLGEICSPDFNVDCPFSRPCILTLPNNMQTSILQVCNGFHLLVFFFLTFVLF